MQSLFWRCHNIESLDYSCVRFGNAITFIAGRNGFWIWSSTKESRNSVKYRAHRVPGLFRFLTLPLAKHSWGEKGGGNGELGSLPRDFVFVSIFAETFTVKDLEDGTKSCINVQDSSPLSIVVPRNSRKTCWTNMYVSSKWPKGWYLAASYFVAQCLCAHNHVYCFAPRLRRRIGQSNQDAHLEQWSVATFDEGTKRATVKQWSSEAPLFPFRYTITPTSSGKRARNARKELWQDACSPW